MTSHDFPAPFIDAVTAAVMARDGKPERGEVRFQCPADGHPDNHPSARWNPQKATWCCDGCKAGGGALDLATRLGVPWPERKPNVGRGSTSPETPPQPCNGSGCTVAQYAAWKQLEEGALRAYGLSDLSYQGVPAMRIPYRRADGHELAVRFRIRFEKTSDGDDRFRWKSGARVCLYGQDRLALARERNYVTLVEGESDCHTLWSHGEPALGVPGASTWNNQRDAPVLDGIETVYVVIEPDTGGDTLLKALTGSPIRERVRLVHLGAHKDVSSLYLADPGTFPANWADALAAAVPLTDRLDEEARQRSAEAWATCEQLARDGDILTRLAEALEQAGVAGEARVLKLIYLAVISRFLPRPVSLAVKGPSSGGKSYTVERVLSYFPDDAYYALTAMSERALAYDDEPLVHRMLVLYEAAGMAGDIASYLMRSLLSEGRIRYVTVQKTSDGMKPLHIEREGPSGLIVTTTAVHLHPESETRMLSLTVDDSPDQTRRVLRSLAHGGSTEVDMTIWHALQVWLAGQEHRVAVPYAAILADAVPTVAVRLRRDFGLVLALIRAHAVLHQASRNCAADGQIVASLADYAAVHGLMADLLAEGIEATVPATVRDTVETVHRLLEHARTDEESEPTVTIAAIAKALKLDKSAASRRVKVAVDREYLKNLETRKGRPARVAIGDSLPVDADVLPSPEDLRNRCTGAGESTVVKTPSPQHEESSASPQEPPTADRTDEPLGRPAHRNTFMPQGADDTEFWPEDVA